MTVLCFALYISLNTRQTTDATDTGNGPSNCSAPALPFIWTDPTTGTCPAHFCRIQLGA
jgi:hypothetical protein